MALKKLLYTILGIWGNNHCNAYHYAPCIFQYVVVPLKRSSAEAFQLMASHALGEAGSPYLTGVISDAFGSSLQGKMSHCEISHI